MQSVAYNMYSSARLSIYADSLIILASRTTFCKLVQKYYYFKLFH